MHFDVANMTKGTVVILRFSASRATLSLTGIVRLHYRGQLQPQPGRPTTERTRATIGRTRPRNRRRPSRSGECTYRPRAPQLYSEGTEPLYLGHRVRAVCVVLTCAAALAPWAVSTREAAGVVVGLLPRVEAPVPPKQKFSLVRLLGLLRGGRLSLQCPRAGLAP